MEVAMFHSTDADTSVYLPGCFEPTFNIPMNRVSGGFLRGESLLSPAWFVDEVPWHELGYGPLIVPISLRDLMVGTANLSPYIERAAKCTLALAYSATEDCQVFNQAFCAMRRYGYETALRRVNFSGAALDVVESANPDIVVVDWRDCVLRSGRIRPDVRRTISAWVDAGINVVVEGLFSTETWAAAAQSGANLLRLPWSMR
ncbi:MAG: hypothetical protein IPK82_20070 [Polyangiaceae bacterium]|nr:hypothetical protein [Polyangiaceae bacterium]